MSIFSNVTQQNLVNLRNLAEHYENQRGLQIEKRFLKQTHDIKLAEILSAISKKLGEVNEIT